MSKEVYEDWKEFGYIEDINNSESKMPETKIFKVSIIDNNEREKLIVSWYKGISFQQRWPFIIKIEKSIDWWKSFRSIDEEDEKLIQV
jgi:seryl-tRNA(Sec) selenium transferase